MLLVAVLMISCLVCCCDHGTQSQIAPTGNLLVACALPSLPTSPRRQTVLAHGPAGAPVARRVDMALRCPRTQSRRLHRMVGQLVLL